MSNEPHPMLRTFSPLNSLVTSCKPWNSPLLGHQEPLVRCPAPTHRYCVTSSDSPVTFRPSLLFPFFVSPFGNPCILGSPLPSSPYRCLGLPFPLWDCPSLYRPVGPMPFSLLLDFLF